jgi:hypothetical protein
MTEIGIDAAVALERNLARVTAERNAAESMLTSLRSDLVLADKKLMELGRAFGRVTAERDALRRGRDQLLRRIALLEDLVNEEDIR